VSQDVKRAGVWVGKRALSLGRHVLKDSSHQTRPKTDAVDAFLLLGSVNKNKHLPVHVNFIVDLEGS